MPIIIFDCDGNLIDSEAVAMPIASDFLLNVAQEQGIIVPQETVLSLFGKTIPDMVNLLDKQYNVRFKDNVAEQIHQETVIALSQKTRPLPGIAKHLDYIKRKGFTPVIATSSAHDRVIAGLKCAGIFDFFKEEHIYSAVTTVVPPQPKPSPAVYNLILKDFGIAPTDAQTSEDSTSGLASALAACIPCLGNVAGTHLANIRDAHADKMRRKGAIGIIRHWDEARNYLPSARSIFGRYPSAATNTL